MDGWIKTIAILIALVAVTVPLWVPRWLEPFLYKRRVIQARSDLAKAGLTPDQYLVTIDPNDTRTMAAAATRLGVRRSGERTAADI